MARSSARWSLLLAAGLILLGGSAFAGWNEGSFGAWVRLVIAAEVAGGLLVMAAAFAWRRQAVGHRWLLLIILVALACRVLCSGASRELSDDAARYHWDGKVLASGVNPYLHAPDADAVSHLHIHAIDEKINHPWYRTCYPPLAELLFAAGYLLTPGRLFGLQLLFMAAELATWLLLWSELRRRRLPLSWLLLAAWSPLIVFQGYLPGHLDVLNLPLVAAFVILVARRMAWTSGVFLGLACLIKPLPLLFLPAAARELGWRGTARLGLAMVGVMTLFYAPLLAAGWKLFSSTWLMATDWSFNGSLGAWLEDALPMRQAHLAAAIVMAALAVAGAIRGRGLVARMLLAQAAFVVCTPTLFPWYLIGMAPLLVLRPEPALLAVGALIPVVDEVIVPYHMAGLWAPADWPQFAEYLPFYGLLAVGAWRRWGMWRT